MTAPLFDTRNWTLRIGDAAHAVALTYTYTPRLTMW